MGTQNSIHTLINAHLFRIYTKVKNHNNFVKYGKQLSLLGTI